MNVSVSNDVAIVNCPPETIFVEYSFGIETAINWFFGKGVSKLKIERSKQEQNQIVTVTPLTVPKVLTFSQVTSVGLMAKDGYWPIELEDRWTVPGERNEVRDGQHRLWRANQGISVVQSYGLAPNTTLGLLAYGLSDLATGLFWLGGTWVKYQGSMGTIQFMTDKGFANNGDLQKYIMDDNPGYSLHQKVATLSK